MLRFACRALLLLSGTALAQSQSPPDQLHAWRSVDSYGSKVWEYDDDGRPPPANATTEERRHETLVQIGIGTAGGAWAVSIITAGLTHITQCNLGCADNAWALLYLPVAGPIILAALPVTRTYRDAPFFITMLTLDATLQVGGGVLALVGWFWKTRVVRVRASRSWNFALAAPGALAGASFGGSF